MQIFVVDLEYSSLDINKAEILQIALLALNKNLQVIDTFNVYLKYKELDQEQNIMFLNNGLIDKITKEGVCVSEAELKILDFVSSSSFSDERHFCGISIVNDLILLKKYMPHFTKLFSYKAIDLTAIDLIKKISGECVHIGRNVSNHRADGDVLLALEKLRKYGKK